MRDEPVVMVHPVDDSYRWCVAETNAQGMVTSLHDKQPGLPAPVEALIGVYYFPEIWTLCARRPARRSPQPKRPDGVRKWPEF